MELQTSDQLDAAIDAIVGGTHDDPFSVLGPHRARDQAGEWVIRTFQPAARAVHLLGVSDDPLLMTRRPQPGIFEAQVVTGSDQPPGYRLRIAFDGERTIDVDDPYRYPRVVSDFDLYLLGEGTHYRLYEKLGAHAIALGPVSGLHFAVWAPTAQRVSVVGDFNGWDGRVHAMRALRPHGVWEIFLPGLGIGEKYKFEIRAQSGAIQQKADPYATRFELPPRSASIAWDLKGYEWRDDEWMRRRPDHHAWLNKPLSIYEVHLGSWARVPEEGERFLTYRELEERLIPYVKEMGFTHIQLLPVMEHPFSGSWGYQVIGFFAPTSRFGPPEDFKAFVDACHREGIGVFLDWVPGHFPKDAHGLARFDGTALYEHEDPRLAEHRDWGTLIFNYGRHEVRNFLLGNALFWLDEYHADGLRVDAVASMLYLDYSRRPGEWLPNRFGGNENLEAIEFIRLLNTLTHGQHPGSVTVAEESTAWPAVSRPVYVGGLGFTYKWNMGWMHDVLEYARQDPIFRRWAHNQITFSMLYAYHENFVLPLSHDEVVHEKGSMLAKMPGDLWQQCANLRLFYGFLFGHPGKKLLFMGNEFGQAREWNHDRSLDWHLLEHRLHAGVKQFVRDVNHVYRHEASLHELDFDPAGFQWIDCTDHENSVVSFLRRARDPRDFTVMVLNFTPRPRHQYRVGVPEPGRYVERLNSDAEVYGGSNLGNSGSVMTDPIEAHGYPQSLALTLPPLSFLLFKRAAD